MGYFNHFAGGGALVWSGGSEPTGEINPAAVAVMAERGIDISGEYPKPWTGEIVQAADVIVSMGCGEAGACRPRAVDTKTGRLTTRPAKICLTLRLIRDEIERRVLWLLMTTCESHSALSRPLTAHEPPT